MKFSFFYHILIAILLFLTGIFVGLGFEEFHHRLVQWFPGNRKKIVLRQSTLEDEPSKMFLKLKANPILETSWRFPEILLFLQMYYIKKQEKVQEILEWGEKKFYSSPIYPFWRLKCAIELYKAGYRTHAKELLEKEHFLNFWIEPELLKQKGVWAYQEGYQTIACNFWETLEKKFPFSKAFRDIKKDFSDLKIQK